MGNLIVEQYPEDIKLGVKQVLRVMCGTEQVWPRQTGFTCVVKIKGGSTYTKVFSKHEIQSIFSTGGAYA